MTWICNLTAKRRNGRNKQALLLFMNPSQLECGKKGTETGKPEHDE